MLWKRTRKKLLFLYMVNFNRFIQFSAQHHLAKFDFSEFGKGNDIFQVQKTTTSVAVKKTSASLPHFLYWDKIRVLFFSRRIRFYKTFINKFLLLL